MWKPTSTFFTFSFLTFLTLGFHFLFLFLFDVLLHYIFFLLEDTLPPLRVFCWAHFVTDSSVFYGVRREITYKNSFNHTFTFSFFVFTWTSSCRRVGISQGVRNSGRLYSILELSLLASGGCKSKGGKEMKLFPTAELTELSHSILGRQIAIRCYSFFLYFFPTQF